MSEDGYRKYQEFFERPPQVVVEWNDGETGARGWLVINSLRNGAAGGGTRMRKGGTREEALFLAKTMEIKFGISGPDIGGAKSVIDFDPDDPRKGAVLERWFASVGAYLRRGYGTGGDLNVDEVKEVIPMIGEVLGLRHPQEGIVRGHLQADDETCGRILGQLKEGVELKTTLSAIPGREFALADLITGRGVQAAATAYYEEIGDTLKGKRVLVEGFGAVGGSGAYYLTQAGASVVGILSMGDQGRYRWCLDPKGLDTAALLRDRDRGRLPAGSAEGPGEDSPFWSTEADVFVPAAASYNLTESKLDRLRAAGVKAIVCGANTPFADHKAGEVRVQKIADQSFAVIPDFIANCGMARVFAYLMNDGADLHFDAIDADVEDRIRNAVKDLLAGAGDARRGLLERAFSRFIR